MTQKIALLGSTGSIGEQTLDVMRSYPDQFEAVTLTARNNWKRLAAQAVEFSPDSVVISNKEHYQALREALADHPVKVYAGDEAVCQVVAGSGVDVVVNALVGYAGLDPTVCALKAGKKLALANKESLVVAGDIVMRLSADNRAPIIPVDSEHSAIFQCLLGEVSPVSKVILTASGGPFLDYPAQEMSDVTVEQALAHPRWNMGPKISIDSATLMNKGLEVIEASWLFGLQGRDIEVLVHPQSVIHSFVEFADGAVKAQLGMPDMRMPIQYALTFPQRWPVGAGRLDLSDYGSFTFRQPDHAKFPALGIAYSALERGGNAPCTLNAANEVAVASFLDRKIRFTDIPKVIEYTLENTTFVTSPSLDDYRLCDREARDAALGAINQKRF